METESSSNNPAFIREASPENRTLIEKGQILYQQNKDDDVTLQCLLDYYVRGSYNVLESLIEKDPEEQDLEIFEKILNQSRIVLNGIMDAAGENQDVQICIQTKDILESFFDPEN